MRVDTRLCEQCGETLERRKRESPRQFRDRRFCSTYCMCEFRVAQTASRFWDYIAAGEDDACWEWIGSKTDRGYGVYSIRSKSIRAHRYVWEQMNQQKLNDRIVLHSCDNPSCCNPRHLSAGSPSDNNADMRAKGRQRHPLGEETGNAKLTEAAVREIRNSDEALSILAARHGVAKSAICNARSGKTWGHVS